MSGRNWRIMILLPWLALPLTLGCYAVLWSRLPATLAVQFDQSGAVTNSLGRTPSLLLDTALLTFVLGQFTFRLWSFGGRELRAVVVAYYGAVVFITTIFLAILKYNL
ncbi:MAG TPA: hypothetical protein VF703_01145 [Pyrinomonadaceae bacterium]